MTMHVICYAAIIGGALTLVLLWPVIGRDALLVAPFGGSFAALQAGLILFNRARSDAAIESISSLRGIGRLEETPSVWANHADRRRRLDLIVGLSRALKIAFPLVVDDVPARIQAALKALDG